jgi:uncharacterized protein (DUF1684 family)
MAGTIQRGVDPRSAREPGDLDFNFAYHPSCVHDPRWSCRLAPADNHLPILNVGGKQLAQDL